MYCKCHSSICFSHTFFHSVLQAYRKGPQGTGPPSLSYPRAGPKDKELTVNINPLQVSFIFLVIILYYTLCFT